MKETIGIGIITKQPRDTFQRAFDFHHHMVDHIVVINDGDELPSGWDRSFRSVPVNKEDETMLVYIKNPENIGVGKSKNKAMQHLLNMGCQHIFLMEDDIYIKDNNVFDTYIKASKVSGIQHFNYSQHGVMNKIGYSDSGEPNTLLTVNYGCAKISFFRHCVGAFSYYNTKCLNNVGLMDERYYNACEHVDHTYQIIKAGMHPPFWYFADIDESWKYIGDNGWSIDKSTISSNPNHKRLVDDADKIFLSKNGMYPTQIPQVTYDEFTKSLKEINHKYGKSNNSGV
jgi:hypothetical protein